MSSLVSSLNSKIQSNSNPFSSKQKEAATNKDCARHCAKGTWELEAAPGPELLEGYLGVFWACSPVYFRCWVCRLVGWLFLGYSPGSRLPDSRGLCSYEYNFYSIRVTEADWQSQLGPASNLGKQTAGRKSAWCGGFTGDPSTATHKLGDLGLVTSPLWPQVPQLME